VIHLTHGMPHRILVSMADFPKGFPVPYVCPTASKSFLKSNRATMKRLLMALIDATHFFKTRKEESKKIMAKYTRHTNQAFLESAYQSSNKLFEQVPLVNREGMDVQTKDAVLRKPGSILKVDDVVDDSLVLELEKEGFISVFTNKNGSPACSCQSIPVVGKYPLTTGGSNAWSKSIFSDF
jgi:ABC-type nitrate/sulfonate/bicarbonate transport system substrate-binding protein